MDKNIVLADYYGTDVWQAKREMVLELWGHRCALCNSRNDLNVHHRTYERLGHELITDLIPLCKKCHTVFHNIEQIYERLLVIKKILSFLLKPIPDENLLDFCLSCAQAYLEADQ